MNRGTANSDAVHGGFVDVLGERHYAIHNVDKMPPFFTTIVSNVDHWLFVSSTGGLTAGRVSPESALFPYVTVDKVHESAPHTGSKTILRIESTGGTAHWEPFNREHDGRYSTSRNLYKNLLGNKLCFEEINHDLKLAFRYAWLTSERYGFIRRSELQNLGDHDTSVELIDGLQNILPAGTPGFTQTNTSNLVDAYKWTELDEATGLALFTLYSGITDRAEPSESLKANTAFSLGLEGHSTLVSSNQLGNLRAGIPLEPEVHTRGIRGAYFVKLSVDLPSGATKEWQIVTDVEQTQAQVVDLHRQLRDPAAMANSISNSISQGSDELARIMAAADGFQTTAEEHISTHHYANVLFNVLRGGIVNDQYTVSSRDFAATISTFNRGIYQRSKKLLKALPAKIEFTELLSMVREQGDPQLERLCCEYLPITFGRRHGDPSRPWNQFAIKIRDERGDRLLSYQGNWRDIFQNWEALTFSYPAFVENMIAKFVNASTADGYNPYRITKEGIDWEVEEPDDPWSYIGYWGDHQIIYLQKLLELSRQFHPARLGDLLHEQIFSYANVPYRIEPFDSLLGNPKHTVVYDEELARQIEQRVTEIGADGKLLLDADGTVYRVNLLEKLLVPLLGKLGNLVIDGGIWMNTQRPEWNDANNALVGHGLSMVTLCYMRRYIDFLKNLLEGASGSTVLSGEVSEWLSQTAAALARVRGLLGNGPISAAQRFETLVELGQAASRYRLAVYEQHGFSGKTSQAIEPILTMLDDALAAIDHSIETNRRDDGLYHAYNLLEQQPGAIEVDTLYPMLEGQVAALSTAAIDPAEAVNVLESLFESDIFRTDQNSFMLYPDRELPGFLAKNRLPEDRVQAIPLLRRMLDEKDDRVIVRDASGCYRFSAEFTNVGDLNVALDKLTAAYGDEVEYAREPLQALYELVFNHKAFTGRSGTMFGFEGLGSIYWHMVSKLLLAIDENFFAAIDSGADEAVIRRLGELYYRVRAGIGFNKTPAEYGAFPTDPYSHTPRHGGAKQPGMTGQVKEEILSRFAELGIRVDDGAVRIEPALLRKQEFVPEPRDFCFLDVDGLWQDLTVPGGGLAFTWCQVPFVYLLDGDAEPSLTITRDDGAQQTLAGLALSTTDSRELFNRSGRIRRITVTFGSNALLTE